MLGVMALLYAEGGVARFYSGFGFALLQGRAPERRWRLAEAAARYAGQPWTGCGDAAATRRRCPKMFVADAAAATRRRRPKMFVADAQSRRRVSRRGARRPAVALRRHGRERGRPRRARGLQGAGAAQDGLRVRGPAREPRRKLRCRVPDDARSTRHTHKEQPPRLHAADAQRTDAAAPRGRLTKNTRRRRRSAAAAGWRALITPLDTAKTVLQVEGAAGLEKLGARVAAAGPCPSGNGPLEGRSPAAAATRRAHDGSRRGRDRDAESP